MSVNEEKLPADSEGKTTRVTVANQTPNRATKATTMNDISNSDVKRILGAWYDGAEEMSERTAQMAYDTISQVDNVWYDMIPVRVKWQKEDPYDDYADMKATVEKEGFLRVFSGGSEPKYKSHTDNVKGRAVHDWFGHLQADCNFSQEGEWSKYNHVKHRYPSWVRPLLFTEIVGQRAAASYYKDGFFDDRFKQKAALAPRHITDLARTAYTER